ncbi:MAG TPA: hypothetical protein EYQ73_03815 [Candidatus Poseidoniales archaeon]|jgi:hypothetical protein|nr:MAG: hypothetical protein CXT71_02040 [Euryarchaeota archaeon]HIF45908.1 hypothetical protein [Candidatus Poseidoniales archaeon]HIL65229.1 hypothetical protein [Candidatus Poseidoniales archaeon]
MEEKVGFRRGLSAAIVLGLYAGFMLAVGVAQFKIEENALKSGFTIWIITIIVSAVLLTPILSRGRRRGRPDTEEDVIEVREQLRELNEGVGGWRTLSHVRGEGMGVSVSLSDASNPLLIIESALQLGDRIRLIFRFSKTETDLRDRVLPLLEQMVNRSRIQRRTKSLTVMPDIKFDRGVIITRAMMLCPPLMVGGALGFSSVAPGETALAIAGGVAGAMLGFLIITNKGT